MDQSKLYFGDVTQDQQSFHETALQCLNGIISDFVQASNSIGDPSEAETDEFMKHFTPKALKKLSELCRQIKIMMESYEKFSTVMRKPNRGKEVLSVKASSRKAFNKSLNKLRNSLLPDSCLNNLLMIGDHHYKFISKTVSKDHVRENLVYGCAIEDSEVIVTLSRQNIVHQVWFGGGETKLMEMPKSVGRASFDDYETAVQYFTSCLDSATRDHLRYCTTHTFGCSKNMHVTRNVTYYHSIDLPIYHSGPNGKTGEVSYMNTNDKRLINCLFGGKYPTKKVQNKLESMQINSVELVLYKTYLDFSKLVEKKVRELINQKFTDTDFPFMCLPCVRAEPACDNIDLVMKHAPGIGKEHNCTRCQMNLCRAGCGRTAHGDTSCTVTSDEATELLISQSSKQCPGCNVAVHKSEGCNHMTCLCGTEFCYLCGVEYSKDNHGHYRVTEHHHERDDDGRLRCNQFDQDDDQEDDYVHDNVRRRLDFD
jgi:hypothetical protein